MENKNLRTTISILAVVAIAAGAGFYIYKDITSPVKVGPLQEEDEVKTVTIEKPTENTITFSAPASVLGRSVVFGASVPENVRAIVSANIGRINKALKENPGVFENWLDLGMQYNIAGDYKGTREIWEYASTMWPDDSLLYRNLGDLYGYYLNEPQKAEKNLLKAIEKGPDRIEYYFKTAEFYRDVMKDTTKARQIVERGISSNPSATELKDLLKTLRNT